MYKRQVQANVNNAVEDFLNSKRQSEFVSKQVLDEARLIVDATRRSYEEGTANYSEFLQALKTFMEVQGAYTNNWYNFKISIINLEKLTGRVLK